MIPMPTRSASYSFSRVKLSCDWAASPWAVAIAPIVTSDGMPATAASRMAATVAAVETTLERERSSMLRAMWRWVTCAISCAYTPASSLSLRVSSSRPEWMPMNPPGSANALMVGSLIRKKLNRRLPSCAMLESRSPRVCRYSFVSGSSSMRPVSLRPRMTMRPMRYSSSRLSVDAAAVPISGRWSWVSWAQSWPGKASHPARPRPATRARGRRRRLRGMPAFDRRRALGFRGPRAFRVRASRTPRPRDASARRASASRGRNAPSRGSG